MMKKFFRNLSAVLVAGFAFTAHAEWPERPVQIIAPFPAGNSSDVAARIVAERLSVELGKPVIVENRAGASGTLGTAYGAKQPPDGYTLTIGAPGPLSVGPWTQATPLTYDPVKDFVPVGAIAWAPQVLIVRPDLPVNDFKELLEYIKKSPKPLLYGSPGIGTVPHLVISKMLHETGLKADHVPYRGGAQAITDLRGGHIDFMSDTVPVVQGLLSNGSVKALGVSTAQRIPSLPNIPTLKEQGVADFNLQGYILLVAPAKTPEAIVKQLTAAMAKIIAEPDTRKRLTDLGLVPMDLPNDQLPNFIATQSQVWKTVVDISGAAGSVQ